MAHLGPGSRHGHGWLEKREMENESVCVRVRVCAHTFGTKQPGPGSRETQHDATPGPSKSGQNGSGQFRSGQLRSGQLRSGQSRSGQGYLHSRIGQWGLDGWMRMVGPRDGGRRTEDGRAVDVARIEGEDEDVGLWTGRG